MENYPKNNDKPDGKPRHNGRVGFEVVHPVDLFSTVEIQSGLMLFHIVCCEIALASHRPYGRNDLGIFGDSVSRYQFPVVVFNVAVDFLNYGIHEFLRIRLSEGLIKIHDVTHHLSVERDRASHAFLKFQMRIVEQVIFVFSDCRLVSHVVHVPRAEEIALGHGIGHTT